MLIDRLESRMFFSAAPAIYLDPRIKNALVNNDERGPDIILEDQFGEAPAVTGGSPIKSAKNRIEGPNFDDNMTVNGFHTIPPDPTGAVGRKYVVSAVNCIVQWNKKDGSAQKRIALGDFFTGLNASNDLVFDPRVIYDARSGHFIVVALEQDSTALTSRVLVAVSKTENPNDGFRTLAINSAVKIDNDLFWADFPNVGSDGSSIYITANLFGFVDGYGGTRLWIINQSNLHYKTYNPAKEIGMEFDLFSLSPAQVYGCASGTFLVSTGLVDDTGDDYLSVIRVKNPQRSAKFANSFVELGDVTIDDFISAPQKGTDELIDAGDIRSANAVWRNGSLWTANTLLPASGEATAHWYKINAPFSGDITLDAQGDILGDDLAPNTSTYYPSVAVDRCGNLGINFAASAPTLYAGAYYAIRRVDGSLSHTGVIAAGEDYYVRSFESGDNRWGDYSAISIDPTDDRTFWAFGEYAAKRGSLLGTSTEDGRWATAWGTFRA